MFSLLGLWLDLNPGYSCTNSGREMVTTPIRPFMMFTVSSIRNKLWRKFNTGRKKVLIMMVSAPGNKGVSYFVINEGGRITEANLQSYFDIGLQYVLNQ